MAQVVSPEAFNSLRPRPRFLRIHKEVKKSLYVCTGVYAVGHICGVCTGMYMVYITNPNYINFQASGLLTPRFSLGFRSSGLLVTLGTIARRCGRFSRRAQHNSYRDPGDP